MYPVASTSVHLSHNRQLTFTQSRCSTQDLTQHSTLWQEKLMRMGLGWWSHDLLHLLGQVAPAAARSGGGAPVAAVTTPVVATVTGAAAVWRGRARHPWPCAHSQCTSHAHVSPGKTGLSNVWSMVSYRLIAQCRIHFFFCRSVCARLPSCVTGLAQLYRVRLLL